MMNSVFCKAAAITGIILVALTAPVSANAQSSATKHKAAAKVASAAAATYECPMCHESFTAAQAKKLGYKCSCCGVSLVAVKPVAKPAKGTMSSM